MRRTPTQPCAPSRCTSRCTSTSSRRTLTRRRPCGLTLLFVLVRVGDLRRHRRRREQTESRCGDRRLSEPSYHNFSPPSLVVLIAVNGWTAWLASWRGQLPRVARSGQRKKRDAHTDVMEPTRRVI